MANNLLTIDQITRKALVMLENTLSLTSTVNRQYDASFAVEGAKIGSKLRIRLPDRAMVNEGPTMRVDDTNQQFTTLDVSKQRNIAVAFSSAERTMSLDNYAELVLKPRISQLASYIDADLASVYKDIANSVGTPGTTPNSTRVLLDAQRKLNENAAPLDQRYATIDPSANSELVEAMKGFFNPSSVVNQQFKSGMVASNILGYEEINMSQSISGHLTGTRSGTGTLTANIAQGTNIVYMTIGANQTINYGDVFTIAGVFAVNPQTRQTTGSLAQFVAKAAAVANGAGAIAVVVAPAIYDASHALATVNALPLNGATVVFMGAASTFYTQNLVYNKNAITFASADLAMPEGGAIASRQNYKGISMRVMQGMDILNDVQLCRIDVLYGFAAIRPETAVRLWG